MAELFNKVVAYLFLLLIFHTNKSTCGAEKQEINLSKEAEDHEELVQSESKDGKLEIIKQIKKVNDDGSYTIGYEADDGSFKIESRDVLGNIKGTYGYIDDSGQIKRVSYSTSNSSEILQKNEQSPTPSSGSTSSTSSSSSVVQRIPKISRNSNSHNNENNSRKHSSTTRKPSESSTSSAHQYSSSTTTTTQSTPSSTSLVQRYGKLRTGSSTSTSTTERPNYSDVVNVHSEISKSLTSTSKPPLSVIYGTQAPRILLQSRPILRSSTTTTTVPPLSIQNYGEKSEVGGLQLIRPDPALSPTELPLFRRLALTHPIKNLEDSHSQPPKSVTEEPPLLETRSNILRRQLTAEKSTTTPSQHYDQQQQQYQSNFDPQQHVFTLQQGLGNDITDVYSASVTTGTPRPLFTTTVRPRAYLSSTTPVPQILLTRPGRYQLSSGNNHRNELQDLEANAQEESATQPSAGTTPVPVPVVQIPANRPQQHQHSEPLVAIRHPYQRGTILVPLSQIQNSRIAVPAYETQQQQPYEEEDSSGQQQQQHGQIAEQSDTSTNRNQINRVPRPIYYSQIAEQSDGSTSSRNQVPRPVYVRQRVQIPPPQFRPIPVQVDENGFIREAVPTPYALPIPITPVPRYMDHSVAVPQRYPADDDMDDSVNDIDNISPPVSTRDFQKLLHLLRIRQARLEKISELTSSRRYPELYRQPQFVRYRQVPVAVQPVQYRPATQYYVQQQHQRVVPAQQQDFNQQTGRSSQNSQDRNGPVQFVSQENERSTQRVPQQILRPRLQEYSQQSQSADEQSYAPTRRVARLLIPSNSRHDSSGTVAKNEQYLPPDVREMLLLRMLQLAINPALPLEDNEVSDGLLSETSGTTPVPQYKKAPVRNVEILGEETDESGEDGNNNNNNKRPVVRNKRFRDWDADY